jgi:undecaprenyl-phosphate galactose phosphotransferase/putative colanic acid biosynthesis UDP-glucose lipid carrier transferase
MTYLFQSPDRIRQEAITSTAKPFAWLRSYRKVGFLIALSDLLLIVAASVVAGVAYHKFVVGSIGEIREFVAVGIDSGLLFILAIQPTGCYRAANIGSSRRRLGELILIWLLVLFIVMAFLFLLKVGESYSRGSILLFGFLGLGLLLSSRIFVSRKLADALARGTLHGRRAIVIGDQGELADTSPLHLLQKYGSWEISRFQLPAGTGGAGDDLSIKGDFDAVDAAIESARKNRAEIILLALRWTDTLRRDFVRERLQVLPLPVFLLPDRFVGSILSLPSRELGSQIGIELQRAPLSETELAAKRALDVMLAAVGLVALLPLLALVSVAIKLSSPGPVIFRQRRYGFNRREFTIYKFRTMNVQEDGSSIRQACRNDVRVTGLGRVLRATSIDELPQLFNVLRGDMSLVGPRPHACAHDNEYAQLIGNYAFRHHIKPGITGWAQVNGFRGETAQLNLMKRRVDLDLWYINNWSFWLDLRIIARTCIELARRTAY